MSDAAAHGRTMSTDQTADIYSSAVALAPFLAEHYYATGEDLADAAAADRRILGLAAAYARLPALVQKAGEAAASPQLPPEAVSAGRSLCHEVDDLLNDTAAAIRRRLDILAGHET
jgi:hypothetical protein